MFHRTNAIQLSWLLCLFVCSVQADDSTRTETSQKSGSSPTVQRPNILWITSEDNGPQLGCYGDAYADTPNLDRFASKSLRYQMVWSNAPVCAPARTTLISGMYATSLGAEHMRSAVELPNEMKLYPSVLREAGYYCTNNNKTDYNFKQPDRQAGWNDSGAKAHWRNRDREDQPFFAVFNLTISHESQIRNQPHTLVHDPAKVELPAYHPDVPEVRRDWAQYYDRMTEMDVLAGRILDQLDQDGLADSTIVFYYGDHGSGMPRSKRWPFNSGLQVPFILHVPEAYQSLAPKEYSPGGVSRRLVSFVDMGPTAISLAGTAIPDNMQGVPFCGLSNGPQKKHLFGFRGRMDERVDMVRTCTDGRFVYMRHFYPDRPYLKNVRYMFLTPTTAIWKARYEAGLLNVDQAKFWQPKPDEEMFDLQTDPDEVTNIATDPKFYDKLKELSDATKQWMIDTRDLGVLPEAEMHTRAGDRSPRSMAIADDFPIESLVEAAWQAGDAWRAYDQVVYDVMSERAESDDAGLRFWALRGLHLGLQSHATVINQALLQKTKLVLINHLNDPSPSVRVVAAEAILEFGDKDQATGAANELMDLAKSPGDGYYVAIAALNVIDEQQALVFELTDRSLDDVSEKNRGVPSRAAGYVSRLLETIRED